MAVLSPLPRPRRSRKGSCRRIVKEETLVLPGTSLSFLLQRDGCRTLRLTVMADGSLRVRAPSSLAVGHVFSFMNSRLDWIREKRDFFAAHRGSAESSRDGSAALYLARPFTIRAVPVRRNARAHFSGRVLELPCLRAETDAQENDRALARALMRWQKDTAKLVLGRRLARLARRARAVLGDDRYVSSLAVRSLKRRWGSCSVRGDITLAVQLIAMPLPLIDYVICHELCHLRVMNHGPRFHALLQRLLPDAKERERLIRIWGLEHPR